jgi:hypothetical protein
VVVGDLFGVVLVVLVVLVVVVVVVAESFHFSSTLSMNEYFCQIPGMWNHRSWEQQGTNENR